MTPSKLNGWATDFNDDNDTSGMRRTWQLPLADKNMTNVKSVERGTISPRNVLGVSAVTLTIHGQLPSLKNSRPIYRNRKTGKPFSARSDEIKRFYADFALQVPPEYRNLGLGSLTTPLRSIITVYFSSRRSDLDTAAVYDALQLSGVVSNDRWIREHHEYAEVDPKNPRVEIQIEVI